MDSTIQEYYELVRRFCTFVEELVVSRDRVEELISLLLRLYEKALHLPDADPEDSDIGANEEMTVLPLKIQIRDFYWDVFDPFDDADDDKLVGGMVFDDLNDIYRDLMEGVRAYELGAINEAVWVWKWGVDNHWGTHAVSLIKALHWYRTAY